MEALIKGYRNLTILVVVIFAQLLLLAYQVKTNQDVRLIRIWAVTAITPIANVLEVVRQHTIGLAEDYFVLVNVREENRKLTEEMGRLKLENHFLRAELQTAERAKLLSAFQQRTPSRTLAARIIGNATGSNSRVVFVDRGSVNGVMRGMAVVTPDGIVGKVIAAYPTASQVQLITDENFAAGVISQKHRVHGTLKGKGQNKPIVDYVQNEEAVDPGEMFYTSGDDRVFPKGLPAGAATVVRQGKNFKEIYITPAALQHGNVEEVLIVLEGVHQGIPEPTEVPAKEIAILSPPPADAAVPGGAPAAAPDLRSGLQTEADKLRERYKKLGEAQNHTFGEGLPGSKPPDFNLDLKQQQAAGAPKPAVPAPPAGAAQGTAPSSGAVATQGPAPQIAKPKPAPSATPTGSVATQQAGAPAAAKPKPPASAPATGQGVSPTPSSNGAPAAVKPKPAAAGTVPPPSGNTAPAKPKPQVTTSSAPTVAKPKPSGEIAAPPQTAKPKPARPQETGPNGALPIP